MNAINGILNTFLASGYLLWVTLLLRWTNYKVNLSTTESYFGSTLPYMFAVQQLDCSNPKYCGSLVDCIKEWFTEALWRLHVNRPLWRKQQVENCHYCSSHTSFLPRDAMHKLSLPSPGVCLSWCIVSTRLKILSNFFLSPVAPRSSFFGPNAGTQFEGIPIPVTL